MGTNDFQSNLRSCFYLKSQSNKIQIDSINSVPPKKQQTNVEEDLSCHVALLEHNCSMRHNWNTIKHSKFWNLKKIDQNIC